MSRRDIGPESVPLCVIITDAPCEGMCGRAECVVGASVPRPLSVVWTVATSATSADASVELGVSSDGLRADQLCAGETYRIRVVDAVGDAHDAEVKIDVSSMPAVVAYETRDATSVASRDGAVCADVRRAPRGCRFFWTTGHTTTTPVLQHIVPGRYSVTLVTAEGCRVPFLHCAEIATVGVANRGGADVGGPVVPPSSYRV
jgi:hypothetical protein